MLSAGNFDDTADGTIRRMIKDLPIPMALNKAWGAGLEDAGDNPNKVVVKPVTIPKTLGEALNLPKGPKASDTVQSLNKLVERVREDYERISVFQGQAMAMSILAGIETELKQIINNYKENK
jgi:hypothetical protein